MPTYVYQCNTCDSTFEVEQRITADPLTDCTQCATGKVKRIIQPIAVMFKGSGFHINDYSPSASAPKTETETETKTETPAAAPATPAPSVAASAPAKSE